MRTYPHRELLAGFYYAYHMFSDVRALMTPEDPDDRCSHSAGIARISQFMALFLYNEPDYFTPMVRGR